MIEPTEIRTRIENALPGATINIKDLTGGKDHYEVEVISPAFEGMGALARHRKVYDIFADVVGGALHALSLVFPHPVGGEIITIHAPLTEDLKEHDEGRQMRPPVEV